MTPRLETPMSFELAFTTETMDGELLFVVSLSHVHDERAVVLCYSLHFFPNSLYARERSQRWNFVLRMNPEFTSTLNVSFGHTLNPLVFE